MTRETNTSNPVIQELRRKLEELESSFRPAAGGVDEVMPCGIEPLNRLLPGGGLRPGTLVEVLPEGDGTGACVLAFRAVLPWLQGGRACVVVDEAEEFYPAFLEALGVALAQLIVVCPTSEDVWWVLEQAFRCRGVAATVGWLGQAPDRVLRRLQLAAEAGGSVGVLIRPGQVRVEPAWCHVRLLVTGVSSPVEAMRRSRIEVLYCQGGKGDTSVEVDIHEETGAVCLAAPLAAARDARQAT